MLIFTSLSILLVILILTLFFLAGKLTKWILSASSTFECGFSSYFFSRYSFSMHYFSIAIIFLFLDLELCFLMPFFNGEFPSMSTFFSSIFFVIALIVGVLIEWKSDQLDWKF